MHFIKSQNKTFLQSNLSKNKRNTKFNSEIEIENIANPIKKGPIKSNFCETQENFKINNLDNNDDEDLDEEEGQFFNEKDYDEESFLSERAFNLMDNKFILFYTF